MTRRSPTFKSLIKQLVSAPLPDAREYDLTDSVDCRACIRDWETFRDKSDTLVKNIVRYLPTAAGPETSLLRKVQRHAEKCRILAENWCALQRRSEQWLQGGKLNIFEIIGVFLGHKSQKERSSESERRVIARESNKAEKAYYSLERERELLLVESDAVIAATGKRPRKR